MYLSDDKNNNFRRVSKIGRFVWYISITALSIAAITISILTYNNQKEIGESTISENSISEFEANKLMNKLEESSKALLKYIQSNDYKEDNDIERVVQTRFIFEGVIPVTGNIYYKDKIYYMDKIANGFSDEEYKQILEYKDVEFKFDDISYFDDLIITYSPKMILSNGESIELKSEIYTVEKDKDGEYQIIDIMTLN